MVAGLWRGLSHEEAARFSFLLATPIILAAGVFKVPDLFGPLGAASTDTSSPGVWPHSWPPTSPSGSSPHISKPAP